jgi:uncharacterized OsmC-like protein
VLAVQIIAPPDVPHRDLTRGDEWMDELPCRLRVTSNDPETARVSVRRHQFIVGRPLSADVDYGHLTALEYALGAVAAEVVTGLREFAKRRRIELDEIEAVVTGELGNPLVYFEVVGETGDVGLSQIAIKVYVASRHDDDIIRRLWNDTRERLPLARTLASAASVRFTLEISSST